MANICSSNQTFRVKLAFARISRHRNGMNRSSLPNYFHRWHEWWESTWETTLEVLWPPHSWICSMWATTAVMVCWSSCCSCVIAHNTCRLHAHIWASLHQSVWRPARRGWGHSPQLWSGWRHLLSWPTADESEGWAGGARVKERTQERHHKEHVAAAWGTSQLVYSVVIVSVKFVPLAKHYYSCILHKLALYRQQSSHIFGISWFVYDLSFIYWMIFQGVCGRKVEHFLFCSILKADMIDNKFVNDELSFELSLGKCTWHLYRFLIIYYIYLHMIKFNC